MAIWSRKKVDPGLLNNGNEYEKKDRVPREQLNAVVNAGLYSQDFVEGLTAQPNIEQISAEVQPSVSLEPYTNSEGKTFYRFVFKGLKGERGLISTATILPIGTIITSAVELNEASLLKLDGRVISQDGVYADFCEWLKGQISANPNAVPTCTIEEYASEMSTYSQCGKFVINNTATQLTSGDYSVGANSIKLPTITEFIASNNGGKAIGLAQLDEFKSHNHLPKASARAPFGNDFYASSLTLPTYDPQPTSSTGGEETRPKNIRYPYYIVVATAYNTQVEIDINNVVADINSIESRLSKTEQVEVLYDKSSTDPNFNWGYTGFIPNGTTVSGKDFSKYKKLRAYFREGWDGYSSSTTTVEVPLDPQILINSDAEYCGAVTRQLQYYNGIYGYNHAILVSNDKTAVTIKSFRVNPDGSTTNGEGCALIEGVY